MARWDGQMRDRRTTPSTSRTRRHSNGILDGSGAGASGLSRGGNVITRVSRSRGMACIVHVMFMVLLMWGLLLVVWLGSSIWDKSLIGSCDTMASTNNRARYTRLVDDSHWKRSIASLGMCGFTEAATPNQFHSDRELVNTLLLSMVEEIRAELGLMVVLRGVSALEAHGVPRSTNDQERLKSSTEIEAFLFVPRDISIGCAYRKIAALIERSSIVAAHPDFQVQLEHRWPYSMLYYDRYDRPVLRVTSRDLDHDHHMLARDEAAADHTDDAAAITGAPDINDAADRRHSGNVVRAEMHFQVLREDLFDDSSFVQDHLERWQVDITQWIGSWCTCLLPRLGVIPSICVGGSAGDIYANALEQAAHSGNLSSVEFVHFVWFFRTSAGRWLWSAVHSTIVEYVLGTLHHDDDSRPILSNSSTNRKPLG